METTDYTGLRAGLRRHIDHGLNLLKEPALLPRFNITSANLLRLLPGMPVGKHEAFFKEILYHQKLSSIEQDVYNITDYISTESLGRTVKALREGVSVICTFHSGSYRAVNTYLFKNRVPYSLVVSGDILRQQGDSYRKGFEQLSGGDLPHGVALIDAGLPSGGLAMLRELKKGRCLLVYIDGNTGALKNDHSKSEVIPLLGGSIFVKTGIPFIAYTAGVPVVPVVCYRKSPDDIRLRFFSPLAASPGEDRKAFIRRATRQLYGCFETVLADYPEQWEAWLYLHQSMTEIETVPKVNITDGRHGFFEIGSDCFLFDKFDYSSHPLSQDDYGRLCGSGLLFVPAASLPTILNRPQGGI